MPEYYLIVVVLLFALAISDLIVGVSNDAVNFLNSAVGSKVAPRHLIMIVASLGIFVGATFSSGMMEVARKGIFNPEFFFFSEVMIIFLAVMLTDIILLDLFNTFGMPTSTTVSIVFELLGASVAVSVLKLTAAGNGMDTLSDYINTSSALAIISGIFISVGVAFAVGSLLQYLSRLLFSFHYKKRLPWIGGVWAGLALTLLTYFLLIKGIKGASFVSEGFISWVGGNTWLLLGLSFVFWSVLMHLLQSVFRVNVLRIIVLFGTFSLAMAFAGNDLVNFIGVPIAGFESYNAWAASGTSAEGFSMEILSNPVRTKTYLLLGAGLIMILTLWTSKKAQSVTETEVNLGRQDEGTERFSSNLLSREIVRYTRSLGGGMAAIIPRSWLEKAENNFRPAPLTAEDSHDEEPPAFDLVRASVNLTVASMLIAFATSLKLPLSTTYVSFMVAMGTSLADRAWGRDSAVYRVAGVLNVIGGWFGTAFIAFTVSSLFAWSIYTFGGWAVAVLTALAIFFISRTFLLHRRKEKAKAAERAFNRQGQIPAQNLIRDTSMTVAGTLQLIADTYRDAIFGLLEEDRARLARAQASLASLKKKNMELRRRLYGAIRRIRETNTEASRLYLLVYDLEQDILQSSTFIVDSCLEHVDNSLSPMKPTQEEELKKIASNVDDYFQLIINMMKEGQYSALPRVLESKAALFLKLETLLSMQVQGIRGATYGMRNSLLFFSLQLETKDLIAVAARFVKLYERLQQTQEDDDLSLVVGK